MQQQIEGKAKTAATISMSECLQMMQQQGYTPEEAMMMCNGNIVSSNNNNNKTAGTIDNRLYVKAFLVDTTLNINTFRVPEDVIAKNVHTFIGKPLVMQENFDHPMPPSDHPDSLQHWLAYQESFRVGTIIDVVSKPNQTTGGTIYYAIIEITDPNLKQALRDNSVPIYVSPAMGERAATSKGDGIINEFTGVHLAIVDQPAYGIKKAIISDTCGGDQDTCLLRLRKAHIEKHGQRGCGFCVKKALEKYKIIVKSASITRKNGNPILANSTNTSHTFTSGQNSRGNYKSKLSVLEPTTDSNNTNTSGNNSNESPQSNQSNSKNDFANNNNAAFVEREKPQQIPATYKQPVNTPQFQKDIAQTPIAELYARIQQLEMENRILKESNNEAVTAKDTLLERVAGLEKINRRIAIERLITPDLFKNEKERLERIDYYTNHSPATLEELEKTFSDMRVFARKASVNQRTSARVPYYTGTSLGSSGVATSANTTQNSGFTSLSDNESGETITPLQKQLAVLRGGH